MAAEPIDAAPGKGNSTIAFHQPQQAKTEAGLAAAAFAHHPHRVAFPYAQTYAVHGLHVTGHAPQQPCLDGEPDAQVFGFHDGSRLFGRGRGLAFGFGLQQLTGIGMGGAYENILGDAAFHDFATGHDADPVGHLAHYAQVMGNQQHGHAETLLQVFEKRKQLRLYGYVKRRGGLVGDQHIRLVGQGHGDHNALALAAGKLVGIGGEAFHRPVESHHLQQLHNALPCHLRGHLLVQKQDFPNLFFHRMQRIEGIHGLLEDHGDTVATDGTHQRLASAHQFLALEQDASPRMAGHCIGQQLEE